MVSITFDPRQDTVAVPTGAGIGGAQTAAAPGATPVTLALASDANGGATALQGAPMTVTVDSHTSTTSASASASPTQAAAISTEKFSTGMVIGVCIGAFAGAVAIILVGVVIYRRSAPKPRQRKPNQKPKPMSHDWGKIESGGGAHDKDSWEGKFPPETRQVPNSASTIAPMEKMTMFSHTPSILSGSDHSREPSHEGGANQPKAPPFLSTVDAGHSLSWDSSGFMGTTDSGGRMSPMFSKAIPTPATHDSPLHHAYSAEVIHYEAQSAEVINPFEDEEERKSTQNPFFGSRSQNEPRRNRSTRSKAASRASGASSHYTDYIPSHTDKGKARAFASSHGHGEDDDMYASETEEDAYYSANSAAPNNPFADSTPNSSTFTLSKPHPYAAPIFTTPSPEPGSPGRLLPSPPSPLPPNSPVNDPNAIQGLLAALDIGTPAGSSSGGDEEGARSTIMSSQSAYSHLDTGTANQFPTPP